MFAIHPAPYQDPTFSEVARRGNLELQVNYFFESNGSQPYLREGVNFQYDSRILSNCRNRYPAEHDFNAVGQLIRAYEPSVVFISSYVHGTSRRALAHCVTRRIPVIFVADSERKSQQPLWKRTAKRGVIRLLSATLAAVWVPGAAGRDYWTYHGMPSDRVFEGCYCLDGPRLARATATCQLERQSIRDRVGLTPDAFVFLFVGRLIDQRGLQFLLRAFAQVRAENTNVELLILGNGPWRERIDKYLQEQRLSGVKVLNAVGFTQLPQLYAAVDAYVQPSTKEPYSLSTAQAAASALPIVCTDCVGAAYDYVCPGQSGLIVVPGSVEHLVEAMSRLSNDPINAREMGRRGQQLSLGRTTDWAAKQFENATFSVLGGMHDI